MTNDVTLPEIELRFAVTMNGGVSLAVYIGGVTHELNQLTRATSGYDTLLTLLGYEPRIDVITGTSAGGINGAALALAEANKKNGGLSGLKHLWIDRAGMESLLRQPFQSNPPSLLKGDDYFLPELREAFRGLTRPFESSGRMVDLTITTTLLTPVSHRAVDVLGTELVQPKHAGLFHFSTARPASKGELKLGSAVAGQSFDDFGETIHQTADALALAARATAAFPTAFEPAFIPVDCAAIESLDVPDMGKYADWATGEDRSRYVVDGGVLANTPTRPALQAIQRMPVEDKPVRRVLVLVHPQAVDAATVGDLGENADRPPTLVKGLAGVLGATSAVGSRSYVEEIETHHHIAGRRRDGRKELLKAFTTWSELEEFCGTAESPGWRLFYSLRKTDIAHFLTKQIRGKADKQSFGQLFELADAAVKAALPTTPRDSVGEMSQGPFVPDTPPSELNVSLAGWAWGFDLATGVIAFATDLAIGYLNGPDRPERGTTAFDGARAAYKTIANAGAELAKIVGEEERLAMAALPDVGADIGYFALRLEELDRRMRGEQDGDGPVELPGPKVKRCTEAAVGAVLLLIDLVSLGDNMACGLRSPIFAEATDATDLLVRMLTVEVASFLITESSPDPTLPTVQIELVQLSAQVKQHFAEGLSGDEKLAGMALGRFGGFLKRSWRANDWIWGRLDAIKVLMLVMLNRRRVMELLAEVTKTLPSGADPATTLVDMIARCTFGDAFDAAFSIPELQELRLAAVDEITNEQMNFGSPLKELASLAAYGLQHRVAQEEVEWLVGSIEDDRAEGATGNYCEAFARVVKRRKFESPPSQTDSHWLLTTFAQSRIGREDPAAQMPSDLIIRTAATAAATAATMLSSERSGLGIARSFTRVLRGLVAVPYWTAAGLTHRGTIGRLLTTMLLSVGVSFVALSLMASLPPVVSTLVPAVGVSSLLAVFAYAAMRARSTIHGFALLGLFIPLAPLVANHLSEELPAAGKDAATATSLSTGSVAAVSVFALVLGTILIANIGLPLLSPISSFVRLGRSIDKWLGRHRILVLVLLVAGSAVVTVLVLWSSRVREVLEWVSTWIAHTFARGPWSGDLLAWIMLVPLVILLHGVVVGWVRSKGLRPCEPSVPESAPDETRERMSTQKLLVTDPVGLATGWSAAYGVAYTSMSIALSWILGKQNLAEEAWAWAAPATALVLGIVFSVFVVHWLPHSRHRRLIAKVAASRDLSGVAREDDDQRDKAVVAALRRIGDNSRYLFEAGGEKLTEGGRRLGKVAVGQRDADKADRRVCRPIMRWARRRRR